MNRYKFIENVKILKPSVKDFNDGLAIGTRWRAKLDTIPRQDFLMMPPLDTTLNLSVWPSPIIIRNYDYDHQLIIIMSNCSFTKCDPQRIRDHYEPV